MPTKVQQHQRNILNKNLTLSELESALKSLPNGKAPGRDGFNKEFILWGWEFISPVLEQAVAQIWQLGTMGGTLNESLITLIPKLSAKENIKN